MVRFANILPNQAPSEKPKEFQDFFDDTSPRRVKNIVLN